MSSTSKSPLQIFTSSKLECSDFDDEIDPTTYGIDEEGPISYDNSDLEQVNIPDLEMELPELDVVSQVDPIDLYNVLLDLISVIGDT